MNLNCFLMNANTWANSIHSNMSCCIKFRCLFISVIGFCYSHSFLPEKLESLDLRHAQLNVSANVNNSDEREHFFLFDILHSSGVSFSAAPFKSENAAKTAVLKLRIDGHGMPYSEVCVGSPCQRMSVVFDTGSSDFWVASTKCTKCSAPNKFDPNSSSSYCAPSMRHLVALSYFKGACVGSVALETVSSHSY